MADTNDLREYAASFFKVKTSRVRMWLSFIGGLQRRESLTSTGGGEETEPCLGIRNGKRKLRHDPTLYNPEDRGGIFFRKEHIHLQNRCYEPKDHSPNTHSHET
jgi:hypothetical protein